jgi:subfamily B ATP-binding cassette protein HlyB/CyaB
MQSICAGRTVFIIAHRLSSVRMADRILVLDQGRVVESGAHEELIDLPGGLYAHLHAMQQGHPLRKTRLGSVAGSRVAFPDAPLGNRI